MFAGVKGPLLVDVGPALNQHCSTSFVCWGEGTTVGSAHMACTFRHLPISVSSPDLVFSLKKHVVSSPRSCKYSVSWGASVTERWSVRPQTTIVRILSHICGGECHLIHPTILRSLTWPSLACMCRTMTYNRIRSCIRSLVLTCVLFNFELVMVDALHHDHGHSRRFCGAQSGTIPANTRHHPANTRR